MTSGVKEGGRVWALCIVLLRSKGHSFICFSFWKDSRFYLHYVLHPLQSDVHCYHSTESLSLL
jgi:hypothetical protein